MVATKMDYDQYHQVAAAAGQYHPAAAAAAYQGYGAAAAYQYGAGATNHLKVRKAKKIRFNDKQEIKLFFAVEPF